jgi:hypothetical protein
MRRTVPPSANQAASSRAQPRVALRGAYRFATSPHFVLQVSFQQNGLPRGLTLKQDGAVARLPAGPFDLDDCCALLVGLGCAELELAARQAIYDYLAFVFQVFNPRALGVLFAFVRQHAGPLPAGLIESTAPALDFFDKQAARLWRELALQAR